MKSLPRYQPPAAPVGTQANVLRKLVVEFIHGVASNPEYNTANVVHDCVVYVMTHKPPELGRVDGALIQPVVYEVVTGLLVQAPARTPAAVGRRPWLHRVLSAISAAAKYFVN